MTELQVADAGAASQLVGYGLQPRLRPASTPLYAQLVERHQGDVGFRDLVEQVADGLGLVVLDVSTASGITLAAAEGSPFELRLTDYRANLSADDRLLHGLIHVGIAAYTYPTSASLTDDDVRQAAVAEVEAFIRAACLRLQERAGASDPSSDQPETEQAWRLYLRRQATRDTADGRVGISTTGGMVKYAFERLVSAGLATRASDADGGTYRMLGRYRIGVRELAANAAYRDLMDAMNAHAAGPAADEPAPSGDAPRTTAGGADGAAGTGTVDGERTATGTQGDTTTATGTQGDAVVADQTSTGHDSD